MKKKQSMVRKQLWKKQKTGAMTDNILAGYKQALAKYKVALESK